MQISYTRQFFLFSVFFRILVCYRFSLTFFFSAVHVRWYVKRRLSFEFNLLLLLIQWILLFFSFFFMILTTNVAQFNHHVVKYTVHVLCIMNLIKNAVEKLHSLNIECGESFELKIVLFFVNIFFDILWNDIFVFFLLQNIDDEKKNGFKIKK